MFPSLDDLSCCESDSAGHKTDYETPTGPKLVITLIYLAGLAVVLIMRRSPIKYMLYFGLPAYFLLGTMNTLGVVKMESITAITDRKGVCGSAGRFRRR